MDEVFMRAIEFVKLLKQWVLEARTRCHEVEDPAECRKTAEQLIKLIERFEKLMELRWGVKI